MATHMLTIALCATPLGSVTMNDKEATAEILRRLRMAPEHQKDISFPEFRWCAGVAGSRRADAFFIQPRPPYFSVTYEVKVDRWDFRRDVAEAEKHKKARQFSNFFYYAAPRGVICPDELPEWAGLVEFDLDIMADEYTVGMRVVKQAPLHDREDPDWGLIAGIAKRMQDPAFRFEARGMHLISNDQLMALKSLIAHQVQINKLFEAGSSSMMKALAIVSRIFNRKDKL